MRDVFVLLMLLAVLSFIFFLVFLKESYLFDASIHLAIFSLAMWLIWKKDLKTTLDSIGFPGGILKTIIFTIIGLGAIFFVLFILGVIAFYLGFNDQEKITEKLADLPLYILFFAVAFAPISEELLFRAFLVSACEGFFLRHMPLGNRKTDRPPSRGIIFMAALFGIIVSSVIFGILHLGYGSVVEVVGTIVVGMILAAVFRLSKSVTPCILAHMIYNLLSIAALKLLAG